MTIDTRRIAIDTDRQFTIEYARRHCHTHTHTHTHTSPYQHVARTSTYHFTIGIDDVICHAHVQSTGQQSHTHCDTYCRPIDCTCASIWRRRRSIRSLSRVVDRYRCQFSINIDAVMYRIAFGIGCDMHSTMNWIQAPLIAFDMRSDRV